MSRGDLRERFSNYDALEREFAGSERSWLSPDELDRLARFRDSRRRAAWTWGRVLSKRLLLEASGFFTTETPRHGEARKERFLSTLMGFISNDQTTDGQNLSRRILDASPHSPCLSVSVVKSLVNNPKKRVCRDISPIQITIRSHDDNGHGTAPVVFVNGIRQRCRLSISHTDRAVFVAVANDDEPAFGVDLVDLSAPEFSKSSLRFWFTPSELRQFQQFDSHIPNMFWAAKEAAFKACGYGERFAPRQIEVTGRSEKTLTTRCRFQTRTCDCAVGLQTFGGHIAATAIANPVSPSEPTDEIESERHAVHAAISFNPQPVKQLN